MVMKSYKNPNRLNRSRLLVGIMLVTESYMNIICPFLCYKYCCISCTHLILKKKSCPPRDLVFARTKLNCTASRSLSKTNSNSCTDLRNYEGSTSTDYNKSTPSLQLLTRNRTKHTRNILMRITDMNISEYDHVSSNPHSLVSASELNDLFSDFYSEEKLISLTGISDLKRVTFLEMQVDSTKTGLGLLGRRIPSVEQLKLNNSHVPCIRCSLEDINGIGSLHTLQELYLAFNRISDVSSISFLENLKILDLEENMISDLDQIENIALCSNLKELTLDGNPIDFHLFSNSSTYQNSETNAAALQKSARDIICRIIPQLNILDDFHIDMHFRHSKPEKDLTFVSRPCTSYGQNEHRLESDIGSSAANIVRPSTTHGRSNVSFTKNSAIDASSELTFGMGTVLVGNPIMLLRARRGNKAKPILAEMCQDTASDGNGLTTDAFQPISSIPAAKPTIDTISALPENILCQPLLSCAGDF
ncbi:hypothetical protein BASA50_009635 [Batrachochytrium salamandrivorans]|uniref:Protein phosphatase 1 regulatory subunit 7 n=1 Tax=Batrachochytrium salamandrivorans TaxID=1357716 RepID=A0ABQ8F0G0_9FUNG|nr:hypothetical protein BASA50_009635 [Batrachochytrium salamandrivorans]